MSSRGEDTGRRGCHQGVHQEQAGNEAEETDESAAGAAEVGRKQKKEELGWRLRAETMDDTDDKDRTLVISEGEGRRLRSTGVTKASKLPTGITHTGDEQRNAAARNVVMTTGVWFTAKKADEDINGQNNKGRADQALADAIQVPGHGKVQEDDGRTENGHGQRMAQRIEQAELHAFAPISLHAGNVGDRGEMVVIEPMAKAEEDAGDQCEFERGLHAGSKVRCEQA